MTAPLAPILTIAPLKPDPDVVAQAVAVLAAGGVIAFPTDTLYGIGCQLGDAAAAQRIQKMRGFAHETRPLTFLLPDIGELPHWAKASESALRILNRIFPGPYCAELPASGRVPHTLVNQERRTIGIRIPDNLLCERVLWRLGRPMLTASAKSRQGTMMTTAEEIQKEYGTELDLVIDGGPLAGPPSTVVSLIDDWITILREGRGPANRILMA